MVISFSVKEARNQLLEQGEVYTYRWRRRAFFSKGLGEEEKTWTNSGRTTNKIANVLIKEIGQLPPRELRPYQEKSGFKDLGAWQSKILAMNVIHNSDGWLYHVSNPAGGD